MNNTEIIDELEKIESEYFVLGLHDKARMMRVQIDMLIRAMAENEHYNSLRSNYKLYATIQLCKTLN
jgi:hypothetical protein